MSQKQKTEALIQENLLLKAKILLKDGYSDHFEDIDPLTENKFLKNVLSLQKTPEKPIYQILNIDPVDYPSAQMLNDAQLKEKYLSLLTELRNHGFIYQLVESLPKRIAYRYLAEKLLFEEFPLIPQGWQYYIDGCSGDCPGCFQANYCQVKDDIWSADELELERRKRQEQLENPPRGDVGNRH